MENLKQLQQFIWNLGWFSGEAKLSITLCSQFEGFSGRASEDWEKQVIITLSEVANDTFVICPAIRVVGLTGQDIDTVAGRVMREISLWKGRQASQNSQPNER